MSLKNLLDLRKKDIQIIERIIFKKRPFHKELFLILSVILVASGVIWGISKADNIIENKRELTDKGFSAIGMVSNITETEISLVDAKGTNKDQSSYTLSTLSVNKIETKDYQPLTLSDIKTGDRVIVQGRQTKEGDIIIGRIISFGLPTLPKEETATSTATTTESTSTTTATTTSDTSASSTDTSSPSIIQTIKDTITGTISNIVDTITGTSSETTSTSTSTETEEIATSTEPTPPATTTDTTTPEATTTESTPSPEPVPTPKAEAPTEQQPEQQTQQESLPSPAPPVTEPTS